MLNPLKRISFADKLQLVGVLVLITTLLLVYFQLRENTKTNRVSIRTQLYQTEANMAANEAGDSDSALNTIWALVPHSIRREEYGTVLLQLVTNDKTALEARNAAELYHSMFDAAVFADESRRAATRTLRRLFLHSQTSFYHIHNAFDYKRDGILSDSEWRTWNGLIREMNAHPMLLAVIWQGYQNRYFSRKYARFLQAELCSETIPTGVADSEVYNPTAPLMSCRQSLRALRSSGASHNRKEPEGCYQFAALQMMCTPFHRLK